MKSKKNIFLIDIMIGKYQNLSRREKLVINLGVTTFLVLFAISAIYNSGKSFGEFLYYINY